jgi:probable HAF family extracellular repeat protein
VQQGKKQLSNTSAMLAGGKMPSRLVFSVALLVAQILTSQVFAQSDLTPKVTQPRYRLVDLGTLGGPVSLVTGGNGDLNQRRTLVTNCAATSVVDPEWPNINPWNGDDPYIEHAFRTRGGRLDDLGVLPGGTTSCGQGINVNGTVAGFSTTGQIDPLTGYREIHATRWQHGEILDLGTLGGNESYANFINDRGQITGAALNAIPDAFTTKLFIGATQVHAFLWEHGTMQDLGTLGGPDSIGYYINERGDIAGQSFTNDIPNETTGNPTLNPFLWHHGTMLDLGTLGGTEGNSEALNNRGQVVGESNLAGDETVHPFLWDGLGMRDLGTLGGSFGMAFSINNAGAVAGFASLPGDEGFDAFLWENGTITDLGNLGCTSQAYSINVKGQVVGASRLADCATRHAFLWEKGTMYDLNELIPADSGLELFETHAINDVGVIAGNALPPGCDDVHVCGHAFLLFPCEKARGECKNESLVRDLGSAPQNEMLRVPQTKISHTTRQNQNKRRQSGSLRRFSTAARDTEY